MENGKEKLEKIQQEKLSKENSVEEYSPEQIKKAQDIVETRREESDVEVPVLDIDQFITP
jgi:hypothetical protein